MAQSQGPRHRGAKPTPRSGRAQGENRRRPTARHSASAKRAVAPVATGVTTRRVSARTAAQTRAKGGVRHRGAPTPGSPQRPHGALVAVAVAAVALVAVVLFAVARCAVVPSANDGGQQATGDVEVQVPEGAGTDAIAQAFVDAGLVKDVRTFTQAVSEAKAGQSLQPGTYSFAAGTSVQDIVAQLVKGPNTQSNRLTVPEGLTVAKTAALVEQSLGIPANDFTAQAKASNYVDDYDFLKEASDDSLEGFLWASTYDFSGKDVTADTVIRAMLDRYRQQTSSLDFASHEQANAKTYGVELDDYDILKLASVIEREAVTEKDRPLVSSVFYNRMRDGMPLQSDATMGYVTGGEVTADDLKQESPYNTYLNQGLPPTPICTPSLECIQAALEPASTDYLYFLIIENGSYSNHTFSTTYDDHLQAIEQAKADQGQS